MELRRQPRLGQQRVRLRPAPLAQRLAGHGQPHRLPYRQLPLQPGQRQPRRQPRIRRGRAFADARRGRRIPPRELRHPSRRPRLVRGRPGARRARRRTGRRRPAAAGRGQPLAPRQGGVRGGFQRPERSRVRRRGHPLRALQRFRRQLERQAQRALGIRPRLRPARRRLEQFPRAIAEPDRLRIHQHWLRRRRQAGHRAHPVGEQPDRARPGRGVADAGEIAQLQPGLHRAARRRFRRQPGRLPDQHR